MPRALPSAAAGPSAQGALTDAQLVTAACAGARWAQEALFLRHVRLVSGLVFRVHPSRIDLDDLVQDTFIAAFESLPSLKNPQAFAAWVGSLAIRITHKKLRRRRIAARLGLGTTSEEVAWDEIIGPACPPDVAAELREIYTILASFPTSERIAFLLRRVEGMSLDEVATATDTSLATVKRRIAAAEERLDAARASVSREGGRRG
jgi:RNA polymerase sigma-70 factor (ECF subfamily)